MKLPLIFYIFPLLLSTGVCLECEYCSSNQATCSGVPRQCPEYTNGCVIFTTENTIVNTTGKEIWLSTFKGCIKMNRCGPSSMSFSFPSQHQRRTVKCCRRNLCNKGVVKLPPGAAKPNGLVCPGCFSTDPECKPNVIIQCHGKERKCVYYDMTVEQENQIYNFAKRGCATKHACTNSPRTFAVTELFVEIWKTAQCVPASTGLK